MKVIDLLNKIANNELPHNTKFKITSCHDSFNCKYDADYPGAIWVIDDKDRFIFNYTIDYMRILNYEVEIIEKIKGIEEINYEEHVGRNLSETVCTKISELIREVNQLKSDRND